MGPELRRLVPVAIRRRYALKFAIVLAILGLSVGAIGALATLAVADGVAESVQQEYEFAAEQEAERLGDWIETNERYVRTVSADPVLSQGGSDGLENASAYLDRQNDLAEVSQSNDFLLVDRGSGEVLAQSVSSLGNDAIQSNLIDDGNAEWFRDVGFGPDDTDETYVSTVFESYRSEPVIGFVSPVPERPDRVLVWLVVRPGPEFLRGQQMGAEGSFTAVINNSRTILFHETISTEVFDTYPNVGVLNRQDSGATTIDSSAAVGKQHVLGYTRIDQTNWTVLVHGPTESAYGQVATVQRWGALATFAGVVLIGVLGALLGRNTAVAIDRLTAKATRMERGDLEVDFETKRIDNIGRLYDAFGSMQIALRERIREAEQARRETERYNEQLQVIDRILRHNLHNDMNVIKLNAELLQDQVAESAGEYADRIIQKTNSLLEKTDKQREVTQILSAETEIESIEIDSLLEKTVEKAAEEYAGAAIRLEQVEPKTVRITPHIEEAILELIDNAVVHNDSETPEVTIHQTLTDDHIEIRVSDNGPPIPEMEQEILGETDRDALTHGSGIGLWLVFLIVDRCGGTLTFEENEPRGNTVVVDLPFDATDQTVSHGSVSAKNGTDSAGEPTIDGNTGLQPNIE